MKLCGFLSPEGKFLECPSYSHCDKAKEICKRKFKLDLSDIKAEDFLFDNNYVGFYSRNVSKRWKHSLTKQLLLLTNRQKDFIVNNLDNALNNDQLETIVELLKWDDDFKASFALNSVSERYMNR